MTLQEDRINALEDILTRLHEGASPESVQEDFNRQFSNVSALEIAAMEQQIINGPGPITFEDVLKLCNVHAKMFEGSIEEGEGVDIDHPGHPVRVFKDENLALRSAIMRIDNIITAIEEGEDDPGVYKGLLNQFKLVGQLDVHYERKEKLFFPLLESYGHTAPPKVMWAKDDEIRDLYREALKKIEHLPETKPKDVREAFDAFEYECLEMIFKEESILINILLECLSTADWYQIAQESDAYGYAIIQPTERWEPSPEALEQKQERKQVTPPIQSPQDAHPELLQDAKTNGGQVSMQENLTDQYKFHPVESHVQKIETSKIQTEEGSITISWEPKTKDSQASIDEHTPLDLGNGQLTLFQIKQVLNHLPLEVTFVDEKNVFQYFNDSVEAKEMIFKRTPAQLGRDLEMCHPPQSWPKVSELVEDLRTGRRKQESMWFERKDGVYVYVTYTGTYDEKGEFTGIVETVQDIQPFLNLPSPMKVDLEDLDGQKPEKD